MIELLIVLAIGLGIIAAAAIVGSRVGVAPPLILVVVGVLLSVVPALRDVHIDPEWILAGLLPPLLYSSAVSMPAMNFRREFGAISGLSVVLVIATSLLLGLFFMWVLPDFGFAWGVALGAIISPTDAVATSIIKSMPVSKRVVAILDGESLLNDAMALVLLRTAIASAAATFAFWHAVGTFVYSVVLAVVIGFVVGNANLAIRKRVTDPTVNTIISFTAPIVASVPAEVAGASGLVAAVVAGVVTGYRAPHDISPRNRLSDGQNWRTIELVLEGVVFLTMGLQLRAIVADVRTDHSGVIVAVLIAVGALVVTLAVRAAYVVPLIGLLGRTSRRRERSKERLSQLDEKLSTPEGKQELLSRTPKRAGRAVTETDLERFGARVTRALADIDYFLRAPLGWREGTIVVWAGMRGAVTVAAAQTLPDDTPQRPVLILVAFVVAAMSLVIQGSTTGALLRRLTPDADDPAAAEQTLSEVSSLMQLMRDAGSVIPEPQIDDDATRLQRFEITRDHRAAVIAAQREALLDARDNGTYDADVLESMLANLDADQIALEMRENLTP